MPAVRPSKVRLIAPVVPMVAEAGRADGHVAGSGAVEQPGVQLERRGADHAPALDDHGVVAGGRVDQVDLLGRGAGAAATRPGRRAVEDAQVDVRAGVDVGVEQREARVGRAGGHDVTGISCAFGEVSEQAPSVGSSATVPGVIAAGTSPRAEAVNEPGVAERHVVADGGAAGRHRRGRGQRDRPDHDRDADDVALVAGRG